MVYEFPGTVLNEPKDDVLCASWLKVLLLSKRLLPIATCM